MEQSGEPEVLVAADVAAWRAWLDANEGESDGVWLLLAKKGTVSPTSLTYAEALDEALCSGWIDGQKKGNDETTFRQRFTPRRARSLWSARNIEHVARLTEQGRMRPRGQAEIDRAKADGRWDRAYAGPATATVPADLIAELAAWPGAQELFDSLTGQNRYAVLHRLMTAPNEATRLRRMTKLVAMLARGETPYPQ
ncbi:YdeI/OmpD-associated family protein [Cellulomonas hominis]